METLRAESFVITDRRTIYIHPARGASAAHLTERRYHPVTLDDAVDRLSDPGDLHQ